MLHLESKMYFVDWKSDADVAPGEIDASKVANCTMLDMAVVGNIRPDWFMDKRGDDTDVQYLGDQHVYYADGAVPKLVKQWRKMDFVSQYFTMSVMANPPNKLAQKEDAAVEDGIHWPLILNIPGEGSGDDNIRVYRNHELLSEEDEEIFKLIENFNALGGVCVEVSVGVPGSQDAGRPHIPSNLEVDTDSWVSSEITFSPIWEVPTKDASDQLAVSASANGKSVLEVSERITVESCYDAPTKMMDMSVNFKGVEPAADGLLPWMAVGYRSSDECHMTPKDGGSTPIILVTQSSEGAAPDVHKTMLLPEAKTGSQSVFASMYASMAPLGDEKDYMGVSVEDLSANEGTVTLHFKQAVEGENPETMNMLFAIGVGSELGHHSTRGCFQVQLAPCGEVTSTKRPAADLGGKPTSDMEMDAAAAKSSVGRAKHAGAIFGFFTIVVGTIGL